MTGLVSDFPKEFIDMSQDWGRFVVERFCNRAAKFTESPIETLFISAFWMFCQTENKRMWIYSSILMVPPPKPKRIDVVPQYQIGSYRVDFWIRWQDRCAIVECDGAAYHYAEWSQIERDRCRDRELEQAGAKVFRFPGAQINRSAFEAATIVGAWLLPKSEADQLQPQDGGTW